MRGDALAAVEDLDGGRGQARVGVFVDERVGDGVVMAVELDVMVDVDAGTDFPLAVDEGLRRQRAERGLNPAVRKGRGGWRGRAASAAR